MAARPVSRWVLWEPGITAAAKGDLSIVTVAGAGGGRIELDRRAGLARRIRHGGSGLAIEAVVGHLAAVEAILAGGTRGGGAGGSAGGFRLRRRAAVRAA